MEGKEARVESRKNEEEIGRGKVVKSEEVKRKLS